MTSGIGKTNANEKTTNDFDIEGECSRSAPLFLNAPMAGHKSTQEEDRVRNHNNQLRGGDYIALLLKERAWHYLQEH